MWQVAVFADMAELPAAVEREGLKSPTLVVMGHVVAMSNLYPGVGAQATFRAGQGRSLPLAEGALLDAMRKAEAQLSR
jgi:siroheme synthase